MSALWFEKTQLASLVGTGTEGEVELPLGRLPRVAAAVLADTAPPAVRCTFSVAANDLLLLDGRITAGLRVICQRCLEPMTVAVDEEICLAFAMSTRDDVVPAGYELITVPDGELKLADLLEDSLLLELPLAPCHAGDGCGALTENIEQLGVPADETITPFSGLAEMLRDRH